MRIVDKIGVKLRQKKHFWFTAMNHGHFCLEIVQAANMHFFPVPKKIVAHDSLC